MARQLGLEMVYHLFTLQHVDQLLEYHKKGGRAALHCTTPHFTTLLCCASLHGCITLHDTLTVHYTTLHCMVVHDTVRHYVAFHLMALHDTAMQYMTQHLHCMTQRYTALHDCTILHCMTLHYTVTA